MHFKYPYIKVNITPVILWETALLNFQMFVFFQHQFLTGVSNFS